MFKLLLEHYAMKTIRKLKHRDYKLMLTPHHNAQLVKNKEWGVANESLRRISTRWYLLMGMSSPLKEV